MAPPGGALALHSRMRFPPTLTPPPPPLQVLSLHFFAGEPVLLSCGADNSVKQWLFDGSLGGEVPRLLRMRAAHAAPPLRVRFHGDAAAAPLLCGGGDRAVRLFSVVCDAASVELSQRGAGPAAKRLRLSPAEVKLPPVTHLASCSLREREWDSCVTAHAGHPVAHTWSVPRAAMGEHALRPPRSCGAAVTCVAISACGHFALTGCEDGAADRFNLQSGAHRGGFTRAAGGAAPRPPPRAARQPAGAAPSLWAAAGPKAPREAGPDPAHDGATTFVDGGGGNACVVTGGRDGWVRVWRFATRTLHSSAPCGAPVERGALHRGARLLALSCADGAVRVFDVAPSPPARVRTFGPHPDAVTDVCWAPDARWLLTASLDGGLRVWDVPNGRLMQALRLGRAPVTSLALSPDGGMLATTHVGSRCVALSRPDRRTAPVNPTAPPAAAAKPGPCDRCFRRGAQPRERAPGGSFADAAPHAARVPTWARI